MVIMGTPFTVTNFGTNKKLIYCTSPINKLTYWQMSLSFRHNTRVAFDREMDRQTELRQQEHALHYMKSHAKNMTMSTWATSPCYWHTRSGAHFAVLSLTARRCPLLVTHSLQWGRFRMPPEDGNSSPDVTLSSASLSTFCHLQKTFLFSVSFSDLILSLFCLSLQLWYSSGPISSHSYLGQYKELLLHYITIRVYNAVPALLHSTQQLICHIT